MYSSFSKYGRDTFFCSSSSGRNVAFIDASTSASDSIGEVARCETSGFFDVRIEDSKKLFRFVFFLGFSGDVSRPVDLYGFPSLRLRRWADADCRIITLIQFFSFYLSNEWCLRFYCREAQCLLQFCSALYYHINGRRLFILRYIHRCAASCAGQPQPVRAFPPVNIGDTRRGPSKSPRFCCIGSCLPNQNCSCTDSTKQLAPKLCIQQNVCESHFDQNMSKGGAQPQLRNERKPLNVHSFQAYTVCLSPGARLARLSSDLGLKPKKLLMKAPRRLADDRLASCTR